MEKYVACLMFPVIKQNLDSFSDYLYQSSLKLIRLDFTV